MTTPKPSLRFSEKAHRYWLDGRPVPGVTTLLGGGLPKPAIPYWAARSVAEYVIRNPEAVEQLRAMGEGPAIAALKQIPWQKRDDAAVKGTQVHRLGEKIIHGESVDVPEHLVDHVQGYADLLEKFEIEPVLTERAVASRQWFYAGTFDAIVRIGKGPWAGRTAIVDLKTSSSVYGETGLQVAAYAHAEWYLGDDGEEMPIPAVDCSAVIHVTDVGSQLHPLSADRAALERAFKTFTHIQFVAKQVDYIKGLVGEPMDLEEQEVA